MFTFLGNAKIVEILAENGANLNVQPVGWRTPLYVAATNGKEIK